MKSISAEQEARLLDAVDAAAGLVTGGDAPTAALEKVARDKRLGRGEIRLVANAYNTGRSARQRDEGEDVFAKAASFELADADSVIERLFPADRSKIAAQLFAPAAREESVPAVEDLFPREKKAIDLSITEVAPPAPASREQHVGRLATTNQSEPAKYETT